MEKNKSTEKREKEGMPWETFPSDTSGLIQIDPMGMYTGIPADKMEMPQQDADDL